MLSDKEINNVINNGKKTIDEFYSIERFSKKVEDILLN